MGKTIEKNKSLNTNSTEERQKAITEMKVDRIIEKSKVVT